jgi:hypothetical protein
VCPVEEENAPSVSFSTTKPFSLSVRNMSRVTL